MLNHRLDEITSSTLIRMDRIHRINPDEDNSVQRF